MKQRLIILFGLLIILGLILFFRKGPEDLNIYKGIATISSSPSFRKVIATIENNQGENKGQAEIYSNVFWTEDKVKVEYQKKEKKMEIIKIEAIINSSKDKSKIVSQIKSDVGIRKYREGMRATVKGINSEDNIQLQPFLAFPEKLFNQLYDIKITPREFLELTYGLSDFNYGVNKDAIIEIEGDDNFEILDLNYIDNEDNQKPLTYEKKNNGFTIKAMGNKVIYSAIIKFENGDIINYIFA